MTPDYLRPTRSEANRDAWALGEHPDQPPRPRPELDHDIKAALDAAYGGTP